MVVHAAWSGTFCDRRNSDRCGSETQENTHMSTVGGRKRKKVHNTVLVAVISVLESSSNHKGPHEAIAMNFSCCKLLHQPGRKLYGNHCIFKSSITIWWHVPYERLNLMAICE